MNKLSNQIIMGGCVLMLTHCSMKCGGQEEGSPDEYVGNKRGGGIGRGREGVVWGYLHLLERMIIVCGYLAKIFVEHDDVLIRVNGLSYVKELLPLK